jgi:hypothetical protein
MIKYQGMKWIGHVTYLRRMRDATGIRFFSEDIKRSLRKRRRKREVNIKADLERNWLRVCALNSFGSGQGREAGSCDQSKHLMK